MKKMMNRKNRSKGFTLVELMVVVIIVGILAAVAVPIYRQNVKRAMASEGAALLGSVLTAERVYYAEHNTYTTDSAALGVETTGNKYFQNGFTVTEADGNGFKAETNGTGDADGITVKMEYTNVGGAVITYSGI
ncbi:MAG: Fimbrial protein precursor [candidate division TA06 bacterium ADurb.Bin131]|uniref:Fimbrial protein n=1 Tax=candidate division TA06 bacterium ADurb.Bin131 TaxID=1852827 RepID=A0A1V6C7H8_UNCT6|nr:MAG: Fimbrial protein precursor [candidate division TA06 bacterium ADurb.Bin131]